MPFALKSPPSSISLRLKELATGWLDYEQVIATTEPIFNKPEIGENDLLTINYTSGTTSRPKGVMITHRNAYINVVGTLLHFSMTSADRYLWTLPMFHANGWTFVWTVTAVGAAHVCLRKVDPQTAFDLINRERVSTLCAAPTVLICLANAPEEMRTNVHRGVRVLTAGAPPAAATIQRIEGELGWEITHIYGMTETSPFISICEPRPQHNKLTPQQRAAIKARQGVELITSGEMRVVDDEWLRSTAQRRNHGRNRCTWQRRYEWLLPRPGNNRTCSARRVDAHGGRRRGSSRWLRRNP